jgi:hypothetical protein
MLRGGAAHLDPSLSSRMLLFYVEEFEQKEHEVIDGGKI